MQYDAGVLTALLCHYSTPLRLYYLDYHLGSPLNTQTREQDPTFDLNLTRFVRILRCENLTFQLISELC